MPFFLVPLRFLTNEKQNSSSSPRSPSMQTPPSVPFHRLRSASLLSREPSTSGSLHRVASSMSSPASDSLNSMLRHPPLRRTASELSERPPSSTSRYTALQPNQPVLSPTPPPSHPSSASERLARRFGHHVAGASPEPGEAPYPTLYSRLADSPAPRSRDDTFMSPAELLAFREFLARRAEDVFSETRNLTISPDPDQHSYDFGDFSEHGDSIPSDHRYSPHGFNKIRGGSGQPGYHLPHLETTSVTTTSLEPLDGRYSKSDLLHALSIIRAERARVSSDEASLLASGDTLFDLYARSPSSMSQRQPSPSLYVNPHAAYPEPHAGLRSRLTDPRNPVTTTASACMEEIQDFLPDFLDLRPDLYPGESATNELSSSDSDSSPFLVRDERLASVPEGSAADPSRQRNPMRVEDDLGDSVPAKLPPVNHLGPRKSHSATELDSGRSQHAHHLPSQSYSQTWNIPSDLLHDSLQHQATPIRATVSASTTGGDEARRGYDSGTSSLAEFAELAYSQSITEPYNRPRGESYTRRMEDKRTRDGQNRRPGLHIAVDSISPRESLSRDVGPVLQRQRAMTLQETTASDSLTQGQLHRSASVTASISSKSSYTGGRFRTLSDRAYRHPDVPYSPLVSDMDPPMLPTGAPRTAPPAREPYSRRDMDDLQVSSTETRSAPVVHSGGHSPGEAYSRNASPRPFRLSPHMPPSHGRKDSYPIRQRPTQAPMRRTGSTPDLRQPPSFTPGLPSSTQGVGLSLVDNGAFEAPRPAPEPRPPQTLDRAGILARMVQRGAQAAPKQSAADDDASPDSHLTIDMTPTGFPALSFRRPVWSKKQKQEPRSDGTAGGQRSTGSSESGWKSSFINIGDGDFKPQRKSLFKKKI